MADLGLIETIKVINGRFVFKNLHVNRLYNSLKTINVNETAYKVEDRMLRLLKYECIENGLKNFRLRLEVQKNRAHEYMPDISPLKWNCTLRPLESTTYQWNEKGLSITLFPKHTKLLDKFCNLKSTDRAIYEKALSYAREHDFDDALVMNEKNTIADASIYNVFIVKDNKLFTPALTDGPVAGVLRELLLTRLSDFSISEKTITIQDVYQADELFLTNVIRGIRWVKYLDEKRLDNSITKQVFHSFQSIVAEHYGEHLV